MLRTMLVPLWQGYDDIRVWVEGSPKVYAILCGVGQRKASANNKFFVHHEAAPGRIDTAVGLRQRHLRKVTIC